MTLSMSPVPWGRHPVPGIPVPPFRSENERELFIKGLQTWVAFLGQPSGPGLDGFALSQLLQSHFEEACAPGAAKPWPLPVVTLRIAIWTYFPAPWTPFSIATAIAEAFPNSTLRVVGKKIVWGLDPTFTAARNRDGSWTVTRSERGTDAIDATASTGDDMVLLLEEHQHRGPFPYGWVTDTTLEAALEPIADRTRTAWQGYAQLPYIADWPTLKASR